MKKHLSLSLAIALTAVLAWPVHAATTYYVTTNGTDALGADWSTPTSLTNAVALAGLNDLVLLSNGTYDVTYRLTNSTGFTMRGLNGAPNTVLDGGGHADAVCEPRVCGH